MNLAEYVTQLPRGGKKILAIKLGVTASYLSRLISGDRAITAERALQIEDATNGLVTRYTLRPDLQWDTVRKSRNASSSILPAGEIMRPQGKPNKCRDHAGILSSGSRPSA